MKKIILTIVMLNLVQHPSFAQKAGQQKIDSLLSALSKAKEDTNKVITLKNLANEFRNIDPDTAIYFAKEALAFATKLNYKIGIADAHLCFGMALINLGKYEEALRSSNDALKLYDQLLISEKMADKSKILKQQAKVYNIIGNIYNAQSDYPEALENYFKSLKKQEALNDKQGMSATYNNIGIIYYFQADYPKALDCYFNSLKIAETIGDKKRIAETCNNIGVIYEEQSDYSKALDYYFKVLKFSETIGDKQGMAASYHNIGNIYYVQSDSEFVKQGLIASDRYPKALEYNIKSLKIRETLGNKKGMSTCYNSIGNIYTRFFEKDTACLGLTAPHSFDEELGISHVHINHFALLDSALFLQKKTQAINKELGDIYLSTYSLYGIGQVVFLQQKYMEAIGWFHQSYKAANSVNALREKMEAANGISDCYKKLKQFDKALSWQETYTQLKDSVFNEEKTKDLTRKEMSYEFDKKEAATKAEQDKKDALAKAEIKRQTLIRNSTFAGIGVVSIFSFFLIRSFNRRRKTSFEKQVSEVKMTALRSQMNPHFIFNSLHSINNYVMNNDKKNASDFLGKFAKLMRLILENSREQEVPLEKDLAALELYMQLEAMRFDDKFTYKVEVDESIDKENTLVPPLILQPFVENAILHGLQHKENEGRILIRIKKEGDMINCMVEDNGVGRQKAMEMKAQTATHKGESLGMKITNSRLDIINKIKRAKASVNLTDLGEGMRVESKAPAGNGVLIMEISLLLPYDTIHYY